MPWEYDEKVEFLKEGLIDIITGSYEGPLKSKEKFIFNGTIEDENNESFPVTKENKRVTRDDSSKSNSKMVKEGKCVISAFAKKLISNLDKIKEDTSIVLIGILIVWKLLNRVANSSGKFYGSTEDFTEDLCQFDVLKAKFTAIDDDNEIFKSGSISLKLSKNSSFCPLLLC